MKKLLNQKIPFAALKVPFFLAIILTVIFAVIKTPFINENCNAVGVAISGMCGAKVFFGLPLPIYIKGFEGLQFPLIFIADIFLDILFFMIISLVVVHLLRKKNA